MTTFTKIASILFFFITLLSAQDSTTTTSQKRILLAFEETRFKSALIKEMKKLLEKESLVITVVDHLNKGLDNQKASSYNAVFITNSGVNSKVRPWVTKWLSENKKEGDRIFLHTTQRSKWDVVAPVDGVTSGSALKKMPTLAKEYVQQIIKRMADEGTEKDEQN